MTTSVEEKVQEFFSQYKFQTYDKGEILVRADDNPLGVFYLKSGLVKQYVISRKGEEIIATIFKPGSYFPMSWAINSKQNKYYFEAITAASVWRAPTNNVVEFIKENKEVLYDLLRRVFIGLDGVIERMTYGMGGTALERLLIELLIIVKRLGKSGTRNLTSAKLVKISETQLAALSGLTRETVSRELKVLKDKKILSFEKGTLIIFDLNALENELLTID